MSAYFAKYEPEAEAALSPEHAALVSIAISLKRIADFLGNDPRGDKAGRDPSPLRETREALKTPSPHTGEET